MALPEFTMRQLLEVRRPFRPPPAALEPENGAVHLWLAQRHPHHGPDPDRAVAASGARRAARSGGGRRRILFVGTKRQASEPVAAAAKRCAQYYVNHRWLGGTLTNWQTISQFDQPPAQHRRDADSAQSSGLTKKELLQLLRERDKLERSLGGIKEMGGLPNMLFVIDTNKEEIAVAEATKLGIPVIAILDSNSDPDGIAYPIPGNDDAARALALYCDLAARAIIDGLSAEPGRRRASMSGEAESRCPISRRRRRKLLEARRPDPSELRRLKWRMSPRHGEGPARQDWRRHDGLQIGARAKPMATWKPRSTGCARKAFPRPRRRPAAWRPKA